MIEGLISLEQTILGHCLNHSECFDLFISERVDWRLFSAQNHKVIAFCLRKMYDMQITSLDEDSFQLVVGSFPGKDKNFGGIEYLRQLRDSYKEPTDNFKHFIRKFKLESIKNNILSTRLEELLKLVNDPSSEAFDIRSSLNRAIEDIDDIILKEDFDLIPMKELKDIYLEDLKRREKREFFSTGFDSLDARLTYGFIPGKLTIMAGFTGMAKSTMAINMAFRIARRGFPVIFFSMESQNVDMVDKMISFLTQIPLVKLTKNIEELTEDEKKRIREAIEQIQDIPLAISDRASMSLDNMRYQIKTAIQRKFNPKVIFIDLFGKIEDVDTGENLALRIQREVKRMRVLAQELDVHFVMLVQIGRSGYGRGRRNDRIRRPTLIDIKNANAYAEEADLCLLLHRNSYYLPDLEEDILEVDIAKQRGGIANQKVYFEIFPDRATIMQTSKLPYDVSGEQE